jgi:hypothetical protein
LSSFIPNGAKCTWKITSRIAKAQGTLKEEEEEEEEEDFNQ